MIKASIIVPIYNVERYLRKCLDSLVNQTLREIEIILVNDASPDNSDMIMKEYEEAYPEKIKCIYLSENKCLGGARNEGIRHAKGEYIAFVDSDDYVDISMFEKLYNKAEDTNSELTFCMFRKVKEDGSVLQDIFLYPPEFTGYISDKLRRAFINKPTYSCGKLYKKFIIDDNNILFPEHLRYEDSYFMIQVIFFLKRVAAVEEPLYYYVQHSNSIMNTKSIINCSDQIKVADLFINKVEEIGFFKKYRDEIEFYIINRRYRNILNKCIEINNQKSIDLMYSIRDYMKHNLLNYKSNPYYPNITAEDRFLMNMNEISPKAAVLWRKYGQNILNKIGEKKRSYLYYHSYYKSNRDKIDKLFSYIEQYKLCVGICGNKLKEIAIIQVLRKKHRESLEDHSIIINTHTDKKQFIITKKQVENLDVLIIANPSSYGNAYSLVQDINPSIVLIDIEDYIEGHIQWEYYKEILLHIKKGKRSVNLREN